MNTQTNAASTIATKLAESKKPEAPKYQHYASARVAMRLITDKGVPIIFTGYQFITQDEDVIEYLNTEIKKGLPGILKGELLSLEDKDPMAALKRKHIAEYEEEKVQEAIAAAKGETQDMGKTEGATTLKPATSNQTAN